jgi:hypothetical protein
MNEYAKTSSFFNFIVNLPHLRIASVIGFQMLTVMMMVMGARTTAIIAGAVAATTTRDNDDQGSNKSATRTNDREDGQAQTIANVKVKRRALHCKKNIQHTKKHSTHKETNN